MLIPTPPTFRFRRTVLSHGWCVLAPFSFDEETWTLRRGPLRLSEAGSGGVELRGTRRKADAAVLAHCLRLDEDYSSFYELCANPPRRRGPDLHWVPDAGAGRLLRCPTVWEDLLKMVCTTNCSWALTERMVTGLVETVGAGEFPSAADVAAAGADTLTSLSFGYRAPRVVELARMVADGTVDPKRWLDPELSSAELREQILALPGCGPYVADNVAKLCGHHGGLGIDAWVRRKLPMLVGRPLTDKQIADRYRPYGEWAGLALWCELTQDWLEGPNDKVEW